MGCRVTGRRLVGALPEFTGPALCAEVDTELFFPEKGGSTRDAKLVCQLCDVRQQCLDFALDTDERHGIYGGLSARERRSLARQQRRTA